ncbi:MAG TPA: type II secretion protein F [Rhodospirillaceae bacterium]|jgi:tight adherence protein B|nr:type II secretion system F family protein [Alphaproteobacteria bacterium]HBH27099.1 type II secretion protein F [Rhodospirillaceae bacterium]
MPDLATIPPLTLALIGGGGVLLLVLLITVLVLASGAQDKRRQRALTVIRGQADRSGSQKEARSAQSRRQAALSKKLKEQESEREQDKKKRAGTIKIMLLQAGLNLTPLHFWVFALLVGGLVGAVMSLLDYGPIVAGLGGVAAFFFLPRFVLSNMAKGRQKTFLENFPDALDAVVRLLKAGTPIGEAISMLSKEYTGPIGEEMGMVYDRQRIGVPLHEAAMEISERIPLTEVYMFATALTIQAQTGSSLSEILSNLSSTIRGRFRLKRKAKALAQEATASAAIIGGLPFLVMLGLYFANYDYLMLLFTTTIGKFLFWGAMCWMGIGIFVMRQMINFKV